MFLKDVEKKVSKRRDRNFQYPLYEGYSLVNVPNTAIKLLGSTPVWQELAPQIVNKIDKRGIKKIVLILIDGLGYNMFLKNYKKSRFLNLLASKGIVMPITSGFPSTTAASVTTINTGLPPEEHALHEWVVYLKELNLPVNTLPFTSVYDNKSLVGKITPKILYSGMDIYQELAKRRIKAYMVIDKALQKSPYNSIFEKNTKCIPYIKNSDLAILLKKSLENEKGKAYYYVYISSVDTVTHAYGPDTEESEAEIVAVGKALEEGLKGISKKTSLETLILLTADHGHTWLKPSEVIYLNKDKKMNNLYARNNKGEIIPPTGSPRDVFLHIKKGKIDEAYMYLSRRFRKTAKVLKMEDAIRMGFFGKGRPNKKFKDRAGDILILPYENKGIWYEHVKGKKFDMIGMHGGMSKEEVLIPFAAARLSELI